MEFNGLSIGYRMCGWKPWNLAFNLRKIFFPDAAAVVIGVGQQMGIVDHQKFIVDRFAQANQLISVSGLFAENHLCVA